MAANRFRFMDHDDTADVRAGDPAAGTPDAASSALEVSATRAAGVAAEIIRVEKVSFSWPAGPEVLRIDDLTIAAGEKVFLGGPSGSGKSTLLGLLGGVLRPQTGTIRVLGEDLVHMSNAERDRFRAEHVGLIFQMFNLLPFLSVEENITLACRFSDRRRAAAGLHGADVAAEAHRLLRQLGLDDAEMCRRPVEKLSVGQQQRVAAARALIGRPEIVIADEPTSALDADAQAAFLDLLLQQCEAHGTTLIFVSHDMSFAPRFDRVLALGDLNRASVAGGGS